MAEADYCFSDKLFTMKEGNSQVPVRLISTLKFLFSLAIVR